VVQILFLNRTFRAKTLTTNSIRIIGIAGMIAFVIGSVIIYEAVIPDLSRGHFDTPQEAAAYDEAWKHGEAHLELQNGSTKIILPSTNIHFLRFQFRF